MGNPAADTRLFARGLDAARRLSASRRIRVQLVELEADHRPPHTVAVVQHPSQPGQCQPSRHVSHVLVLPGSTSSSQVASICSKAPRRSLRTRPADELAYVTGAQAGVPGTECRSLEVLYDADKTSAWSRMLQHDTLRNMTRAILGLLFRSTLGLINIGRCCGLGSGGKAAGSLLSPRPPSVPASSFPADDL